MSFCSILLRFVLGLTLMLNGVAAAAAAVQQATMPVQTQAVSHADRGAMHGAMPCHEQGADSSAHMVHKAPADKSSGKPDCCKSSSCSCACPFTAQAVVHGWMPPAVVFLRMRAVRPLALGHPAPALPSLIRPPIA